MKKKTMLLSMALLMVVGASAPIASTDVYHFALDKSAPEPDAAIPSPAEVRLWFTEAPQDNSVAIRVIDAAGEALETGSSSADAQDGRVFSVSIAGTLASGAYTVSWRGIGNDGHVARGDFKFSVTSQ